MALRQRDLDVRPHARVGDERDVRDRDLQPGADAVVKQPGVEVLRGDAQRIRRLRATAVKARDELAQRAVAAVAHGRDDLPHHPAHRLRRRRERPHRRGGSYGIGPDGNTLKPHAASPAWSRSPQP